MKILIYGMTKNRAGIETFIYNYISRFKKLKIDLLVHEDDIAFQEIILNLNYNIIKICTRRENSSLHKEQLEALFKNNQYDAVWMNIVSLSYILPLTYAKKYGVPIRIVHAHSAQNMGGLASKILHKVNSKKISDLATDFWTCAQEAGDWMFKGINPASVKMIYNAINLEDFEYSMKHRQLLREKYNLEGKFVVGHVGRLSPEKNHLKLIEVFKAGLEIKENSHLLIVGEGEERERISSYISNQKLNDKITMLGSINNINEILSVFDVFVLPSKIEGLSVVLIEAQANGLKCYTSADVVSKGVKITDLVDFIDLSKDHKYWANIIFSGENQERKNYNQVITKQGYNIKEEALNLEYNLFKLLENKTSM